MQHEGVLGSAASDIDAAQIGAFINMKAGMVAHPAFTVWERELTAVR